MTYTLLAIEKLVLALPASADRSHAVDGVSLSVAPNEIVCLVGGFHASSAQPIMIAQIQVVGAPDPHGARDPLGRSFRPGTHGRGRQVTSPGPRTGDCATYRAEGQRIPFVRPAAGRTHG